jgi:plasmid stabilization system protein ParE
MPQKVVWSEEAIIDLKHIYDWLVDVTKSINLAKNVRTKLIKRSKEIYFSHQYQTDETLGEPYRRLIVGHYKIVYKALQNDKILVIRIFDARTNPSKYKL